MLVTFRCPLRTGRLESDFYELTGTQDPLLRSADEHELQNTSKITAQSLAIYIYLVRTGWLRLALKSLLWTEGNQTSKISVHDVLMAAPILPFRKEQNVP